MTNRPTQSASIIRINDIYHLSSNTYCFPLYKDGEPLKSIGDEWAVDYFYSGFAPLLLLELRHVSGTLATWFFDSSPKFIGNNAAELPAPHKDILISKASKLLGQLLNAIFDFDRQPTSYDSREFYDVSDSARAQIWELCKTSLSRNSSIHFVDALPEILFIRSDHVFSGPMRAIDKKRINSALDQNFQLRAISALSDGYLTWPSLFSDSACHCTASLVLNDFDQVYKFVDLENQFAFFVLVTGHIAAVRGIYLPSENMVITRSEWSGIVLDRFSNIDSIIIDYAKKFGFTLESYISDKNRKFPCNFLREQHIGHQLWNTLTGLEFIIQSVPSECYPDLLVLGGRSTEAFGPIDCIFPEFLGKIVPEVETIDDVTQYIKQKKLILIRFTSSFISERLRMRVMNHSNMLEKENYIRATGAKNNLRIVLGVRVENRTAIDLFEFLYSTIRHIAKIAPDSTVILDGQNIREGDENKPIGGYGHGNSGQTPLEFELDLLERLVAELVNEPIELIITSGQTISSSLAWINEADCFIAIWGAGLAKYCWLANKPGFVISSKYHLLNPSEMSIYHSEYYMESPKGITYADPLYINDDAGAWQLIPVSGPRHVSFHVEMEAFLKDVDNFLMPFVAKRRNGLDHSNSSSGVADGDGTGVA